MRAKRKLLLVAGPHSHGPGVHEHVAGCALLQTALNENVPDLEVTLLRQLTYGEPWVGDDALFEDADAVVIFCDGGDGHPLRRHWNVIDRLVRRGGGLGCLHFAVDLRPDEEGRRLIPWIGGRFEDKFSINPTWVAAVTPTPGHPITRGVKPFTVEDEWYYNIRFPDDRTGWTSLLEATPDDDARSGRTSWPHDPMEHIIKAAGRRETLMWCVERPDGGRGFGFTGGDHHDNWAHDDYRKAVLNAIVWVAGLDVPSTGVPSRTPTAAEMAIP